jgi:hypothetical protein
LLRRGPFRTVRARSHAYGPSKPRAVRAFCCYIVVPAAPSRTALKILRRSRRTRSSCIRQSTCCQASPSNTPGGSSGPFTEVSNVPFGSDIHVRFVVKGSPAHVSTPSGAPGTRPGIRPVIRPPSRRRDLVTRSSVSRRLSTIGVRFLGTLSRREFRPDYSRPTTTARAYLRTRRGPRRGFTTFHTRETGPGRGRVAGAHCCAPAPSEPDLPAFRASRLKQALQAPRQTALPALSQRRSGAGVRNGCV